MVTIVGFDPPAPPPVWVFREAWLVEEDDCEWTVELFEEVEP